ncbi:hypothetical protein GEMRC1_008262 [Eukaryota sp. GEM-RC1]
MFIENVGSILTLLDLYSAAHPLTLDDFPPVYSSFLSKLGVSYQSDLTLTNLLLWRHIFLPRYFVFADHLFILISDSSIYALPPIGEFPFKAVSSFYMTLKQGIDLTFERFPQFISSPSPSLCITPQRNHYDYVYQTENLAIMSNWKRKKRQRIKSLLKSFSVTAYFFPKISQEFLQYAKELQQSWIQDLDLRGDQDQSVDSEISAIDEFFNFFPSYKHLIPNVCGLILEVTPLTTSDQQHPDQINLIKLSAPNDLVSFSQSNLIGYSLLNHSHIHTPIQTLKWLLFM